ncbi:unnamed protein product [Ambrosiozyma monospora]|uniref:Unnamed protein product n=1 Tax=Ambrosiozyma monospora TaxID=43982 RepID=A0ACB5TBN9_AMBMO|nr:unnamed protein product [Ambrosiozyma monospora]
MIILAQEEELDSEEEEINRIVRQTKDVRGETVKSSQNILNHLRGADDTGANVIGTLGAQREKMYAIEHNLNAMDTQQRYIDDHVKDLEHYNRGLFHIKTSNPFTKSTRKRAAETKLLAQKQADRERSSELNSTLYQTQNQLGGQLKDPNGNGYDAMKSELQEQKDYEQRVKQATKYLTSEADEEDERMEVEFSRNIDEAQVLAGRLKQKANLISEEVESQNARLRAISEKVNKADDKLTISTSRIRGI